jgi:hypothetical protein
LRQIAAGELCVGQLSVVSVSTMACMTGGGTAVAKDLDPVPALLHCVQQIVLAEPHARLSSDTLEQFAAPLLTSGGKEAIESLAPFLRE